MGLGPGSPGNADQNFEIFLAASVEATGIPTLSTSIEITAVALLLTTGLYALHRRAK